MTDFNESIEQMPDASKIFVDKSLQISERILQLLSQKGVSQKELAERMGNNESEITRMLTGMQNVTLRTIAKVEAALKAEIITVVNDEIKNDNV